MIGGRQAQTPAGWISPRSLAESCETHSEVNPPENRERTDALKKLEPLAAIQAWLDGDFGMDEEPALCAAIRKDSCIELTDAEISDVIIEAMDEDCDAAACLERLSESA